MDITETLRRIGDMAQVRQVFGEPVERDGTLVIPVASVWAVGGAGGGTGGGRRAGQDSDRQTGADGEAVGTGFFTRSRPVGVYVVTDGQATWQPVVDLSRIVLGSTALLGAQAVAIVGLVMARSILRRRPRVQP